MDCLNGSTNVGATWCRDLPEADRKRFDIYIPSGDLRNDNGRTLHNSTDAAKWVTEQIEKLTQGPE